MVIWLTGLAGAGKSAIGRRVHSLWKARRPGTVLVDGDDVRRMLALGDDDSLYALEGRRMVAQRIADLCAWLDRQDINVVCCTISLFSDLHAWNRATFSRYFEVFVDTPMETVVRRDTKGLYADARRGAIVNVIGVDLPFTPPASPDMIVDNAEDGRDLDALAAEILARACAA